MPPATGRAFALLLLCAVCAPAVPAQQAQRDERLVRYESVLLAYAGGDRDEALQRLGEMSWQTLDAAWALLLSQVKNVATCPNCADPVSRLPLPAAAMLHLDRDRLDNPRQFDVEQRPRCPGRQAQRALQVADLLATRPETREFARRLFLGAAQRAQWDACMEEAVATGRAGLALFPDDADLLLAVGASYEKWARLVDVRTASLLGDAARHLERALAADPGRATTRVHLGRVLWRQGRFEDARATFEAAVTPGADAGALYLAHTFLGHLHHRAGRSEAAVECFHRALAIAPLGQAAALGLAHALRLRGDTTGAGQSADQVLAARDKPLDPLVNYLADNAAGAEDLLDELREGTRR
ncbi:MAG: tetratricopeptide repeat protein [Vicinamibacteria bacterium]|nr:tetratricopeptide repeat protein [Vicinamibacteria bacterium]